VSEITSPKSVQSIRNLYVRTKFIRNDYARNNKKKIQSELTLVTSNNTSLPLDDKGIIRLQQIIGTFLFHARAIDNTMHLALGTLNTGHYANNERCHPILNYADTHPGAAIRYYRSDMILDASYLSEPKARSRVGGYFYLGNRNESGDSTGANGPIQTWKAGS
jgi:hypothetical protein